MNPEPDTLTLDLPTPETLNELEQHVQSSLSGQVRNFQLAVRGDGLILKGYAHTYYAKQLAQHAVMKAAKLPIRFNEIEVL